MFSAKDCIRHILLFTSIFSIAGGKSEVSGFDEFVLNHIIPACFMAPLKPTFDMKDAQTCLVSQFTEKKIWRDKTCLYMILLFFHTLTHSDFLYFLFVGES